MSRGLPLADESDEKVMKLYTPHSVRSSLSSLRNVHFPSGPVVAGKGGQRPCDVSGLCDPVQHGLQTQEQHRAQPILRHCIMKPCITAVMRGMWAETLERLNSQWCADRKFTDIAVYETVQCGSLSCPYAALRRVGNTRFGHGHWHLRLLICQKSRSSSLRGDTVSVH